MSGLLYVCVYVPEFSAQALLRIRPELATRAVVVIAGDPPQEEVCSVNARASRLGVVKGMTRAELDVYPGITILRRSEEEERNARQVLMEAGGSFTPRIEIQRCFIPGFAMVLDMTGTTRIFGPALQSTNGILRVLSELHFQAQLVASCNMHSAMCLAPISRKNIVVIPEGKECDFLNPLPISALQLNGQQFEMLKLWGICTLGELAVIPEVELVIRLGQEGKRLRQLACGVHPYVMVPEEPEFILQELMTFEAPVDLIDNLLFVIGSMLNQLLARARNRAFALASITMRLGLESGGHHVRVIRPASPVIQQELLLKLLHLDLQANPPLSRILNILISAGPGDQNKVQLGLFIPQIPETSRLDVTLARIKAIVGDERVGHAVLMDTHRPDSFRMERFGVTTGISKLCMRGDATVALRRYRPSLNLSVQCNGKHLTHFMFCGSRYTVLEAYGPWRQSGSWWSADVWSREEWDIFARAMPEEVLLCVITHDLLCDEWRLEATYD